MNSFVYCSVVISLSPDIRAFAADPSRGYQPFRHFQRKIFSSSYKSDQEYFWGNNQQSREWIEKDRFLQKYQPDKGISYLQYYLKKALVPIGRKEGRELLPLKQVHLMTVTDRAEGSVQGGFRMGYHGEMAVVETVLAWLYPYTNTAFHYSSMADDFWNGGVDAWFCRTQGGIAEAYAIDICTAPPGSKVFKQKIKKCAKYTIDQTVYVDGKQNSYQTGCKVIPLFIPEHYSAGIVDAVHRDYSFAERSILQPWEIFQFNERLAIGNDMLYSLSAGFLKAMSDYETLTKPQVLEFAVARRGGAHV